MADLVKCPHCGAPDQEVGKFCEQCGTRINPTGPDSAATATLSEPTSRDATSTVDQVPPTMQFIRLENGVFNREHSFEVPVDSRLLVGRTDPANGVFPEVDVTMWSARVPTPEGALYTIHRKQCVISRDPSGRVWIKDYPDYVGDTLVSPAGSSQFRPIPDLAKERETDDEGAVSLEIGDRILMGQGEGMLIFSLMQM